MALVSAHYSYQLGERGLQLFSRRIMVEKHEVSAALDPTIDFEDLSPGGPGGLAPLAVSQAYANLGVFFNGPVAIDFSRGPSAIPGFAHSGTKAIEACAGRAEFCTTPIDISFAAGQRSVGVWVGYSSRLDETRTVLLQALSEPSVLLAEATATLGPSAGPIPIRMPLRVDVPTGNIRRVIIKFVSAVPGTTALNQHLAVDDVEFDASGPPPVCESTRTPLATLDQPLGGQTVQRNEFLLRGEISAVTPLEEATLQVTGPAGSESLDLLSIGLVSRNTGIFRFGPARIGGMLSPGTNTVTLTVRDCRGPGQSTTTLTFMPIDESTRFRVTAMEVTQAIQDLYNTIPLIAGKRTVIRVYLAVEGPTTQVLNVSGFLSACRPILANSLVTEK
jgi:hypothetical protein